MRKTVAGCLVTIAIMTGGLAKPALAGPSNVCYGQIVAGIAATWPWAHDNKSSFPPSPGAVALWVREFGPAVGVSSVRELQVKFCSP